MQPAVTIDGGTFVVSSSGREMFRGSAIEVEDYLDWLENQKPITQKTVIQYLLSFLGL